MKKAILPVLLLVIILSGCQTRTAEEGEITIDLSVQGADVPSSMYGVFFEEINHAGDGGLYAELVQNRSFEEKEPPEGYIVEGDRLRAAPVKNHLSGEISDGTYRWTTEEFPGWSIRSAGPAQARMALTKEQPLHPATPNALKINLPANAGEVSLINGGYWGMGLTAGEKYLLRFYLNTGGYRGTVSARLADSAGRALAEEPVSLQEGNGWKEYRLPLIPGMTVANGHLELVFNGTGTLLTDYVSLFPENTFMNRPNGLRKDVAEFLAALKPAFVRWPGGCIVEGITLSNRVQWKKTLGDPMTRSGEYDTWGYRNTYGFGYHEFLQFCEDIGAKGMYVCNVGLGCEYRSADACEEGDVHLFIADALDAIEYAIGDPATPWGRLRADAGQPQPFPLQYVEIGNENWGSVYDQRFDQFYEAIKSRYPQLTLISNHGLGNGVKNIKKTDMIDPHWYVAPDYFFKNAGIFDTVARGKYTVYVGEYACNSGVGSGNLLAALSEAAFITGMERNSDLVTMASYAPLFENSHDRTWPVNLIWINSRQVIGRSSYYVQKMFAENRPTYNLATNLTPRPLRKLPFKADGLFGAGTWLTQAEYKDFKVIAGSGQEIPVIPEMTKWNDEWTLTDSTAAQLSNETMTGVLWTRPVSGAYTYTLKARKTGGSEGFLIYFGISGPNRKGYLFNIGGWMNTQTALEATNGGSNGVISNRVSQTIETGRWYDIRIEVTNEGADLWIDGSLTLSYRPVSSLHQFAISGYDESTGEVIVKVVNADEEAWTASVELLNGGKVPGTGSVIALSSGSLDDENSFAEPEKITPQLVPFQSFRREFDYTFGARSFTILRIKADRKR